MIDLFPADPNVYRPPAEADSLIVRLASGCPHNRCRFCAMYRGSVFARAEICDIDRAASAFSAWARSGVRRIFLGDGDPMALPQVHLEEALRVLARHFPGVNRFTAYGSPASLLSKGVAGLGRLRSLGLTTVYLGLESGADEVLELVCKGNSAAHFVEACKISRSAGLKVSATAILGLGGRRLSGLHAARTGEAVNGGGPNYFSVLTLIPGGNAEFLKAIGPMTRYELLDELRGIISAVRVDTVFRNDHSSNFIDCNGRLQRDKEALLARISAAMAPGPGDPWLSGMPLFIGEGSL